MLPASSTLKSSSLHKLAADLLLPQILHATLEAVINKALALNVRQLSLISVEQKTLTLELSEVNSPISFTVVDNAVLVHANIERSDCTIQTSLQTLKKLKVEQQLTSLIKEGELDVVGDIKVAQQFANIAEQLEIDWQSELAKNIGDVPTHKIVQLGYKATDKIKGAVKQIESDIGEYVVHEKRLVVTNSQVHAFNQSVAEVSAHVDSLSARIYKVAATLAARSVTNSDLNQ